MLPRAPKKIQYLPLFSLFCNFKKNSKLPCYIVKFQVSLCAWNVAEQFITWTAIRRVTWLGREKMMSMVTWNPWWMSTGQSHQPHVTDYRHSCHKPPDHIAAQYKKAATIPAACQSHSASLPTHRTLENCGGTQGERSRHLWQCSALGVGGRCLSFPNHSWQKSNWM